MAETTDEMAAPQAVDLDEQFKNVAQQLRPQRAGPGDPGLSVEQAAHDRTRKLVGEMKGVGLLQLTELRDTLDDLMRAIDAKAENVEREVNELAGFVSAVTSMVRTVRGPVDEQARIINAGLKPAPGKTVTSR